LVTGCEQDRRIYISLREANLICRLHDFENTIAHLAQMLVPFQAILRNFPADLPTLQCVAFMCKQQRLLTPMIQSSVSFTCDPTNYSARTATGRNFKSRPTSEISLVLACHSRDEAVISDDTLEEVLPNGH
jgi:hypothetical protein